MGFIILCVFFCAVAIDRCSSSAAPPDGLRDLPFVGLAEELLDGEWTVHLGSESRTQSHKCTVPGDTASCLESIGPASQADALFDDTWLKVGPAWQNQTWKFGRGFTIPPKSAHVLVFDGIKMGAHIFVNGQLRATSKSQFLRTIIEPSALRAGQNFVEVVFPPLDRHNPPIDIQARYMACSGGWDWAPYLDVFADPAGHKVFTSGIWKSVYLVELDSGCGISAIKPQITYLGEYPRSRIHRGAHAGFAVEAQVQVDCFLGDDVAANVSVSGSWSTAASATTTAKLSKGRNTVVLHLKASSNVALWWPAGLGAQPLFHLRVSLGDRVSASRRIGFRYFALVTDTQERAGRSSGNSTMRFKVNGVDVYSRGFNLIPMEDLEGRVDAGAQRQLIMSTLAAGGNTLRVWGGGIFPYRELLDACDEVGIMLYHDMMYTGDAYFNPAHDANATQLQADEIVYQVTLRSHHTSIVIWDACNECHGQGVYSSFVMTNVARTDASRSIWPSCPSDGWASGVDRLTSIPDGRPLVANPFSETIETHGPYQHGDGFPAINSLGALVLFPPNTPPPLQYGTETGAALPGRYASEFGCAGMSSFESMSPTLSAHQWGIHSDAMKQRNYPCDNIIAVYFGNSTSRSAIGKRAFQKQLYLCMLGQAMFLKQDIETRRGANEFGTILWQLNEIWPTGGWGSVEYGTPRPGQVIGGRWKPIMYWLKYLFRDVGVSCGLQGCYVKNDGTAAVSTSVQLSYLHLSSGEESIVHTEPISDLLPGKIHWYFPGGISHRTDVIMLIRVKSLEPVPVFLQVPYLLDYPRDSIVTISDVRQASSDSATVTISSSKTSLFVTLTTQAAGVFSDNAFLMAPGKRVLTFTSFPAGAPLNVDVLETSLRVEHLALVL